MEISIELTKKGESIAKSVLARHELLKSFLVSLGVSHKTADEDACRMEHILSVETLEKIRIYIEKSHEKSIK